MYLKYTSGRVRLTDLTDGVYYAEYRPDGFDIDWLILMEDNDFADDCPLPRFFCPLPL